MADIYDWSVIAADNDDADAAINWMEGQFPDTVNNSARQMMARIAEWIKDQGILTATGAANAIAVATTNTARTTPLNGMAITFKAALSNTGASTLSINGGGAIALRKIYAGDTQASSLDAGDVTAQGVYVARYDSGANSNAGAWILVNPTNQAEMQALITTALGGAATKDTPVDADAVVITDSADSGKTKRVLWSRVKAVLKGYFDAIYISSSGTVPEENLPNRLKATQISATPVTDCNLVLESGWTYIGSATNKPTTGSIGMMLTLMQLNNYGVQIFFDRSSANGNSYKRTVGDGTFTSWVMIPNSSYVDSGDSANASAAAAAQSTANAANSAASTAQNTANARIIRDNSSHAGFISGNVASPYMRFGTSGTGTVVPLARIADLPNVSADITSYMTSSTFPIGTVMVAGGTSISGSAGDLRNGSQLLRANWASNGPISSDGNTLDGTWMALANYANGGYSQWKKVGN